MRFVNRQLFTVVSGSDTKLVLEKKVGGHFRLFVLVIERRV